MNWCIHQRSWENTMAGETIDLLYTSIHSLNAHGKPIL